jgi:predicted nuclease of predicted toxin-antitoxin system
VKLKLDENIPTSAKPRLAALGHDVDTVASEGLTGRNDRDVWAAAQADGRMLVTQDLDFSDARLFSSGTHAGVFVVRLPDSKQSTLGEYLAAWFGSSDAESWSRCLVVATPTKIRVVRPPP